LTDVNHTIVLQLELLPITDCNMSFEEKHITTDANNDRPILGYAIG